MSLNIPKGAVYAEFTGAAKKGKSFTHNLKYLDASERTVGMQDDEVVSASSYAEWSRQVDAIIEELQQADPPVHTQRPTAPNFP